MSAVTPPPPMQLGPYGILSPVASGGMAEVYVAKREGPHGFQKLVALKRVLPQLTSDKEFVDMFIDEARVSAQLSHPNIVHVFDFGEDQGEYYMAMEYVRGTSCARLIRAIAGRSNLLPLDAILYLIHSVLRGLEYAHDARGMDGSPLNIVHRDVSPGNILLSGTGAIKLTDFGIARAAQIERRTDAGQLKGKLGYMSPEQVLGRDLDARSDLFTAGIVLAELLVGEPIFTGAHDLDILLKIRDANLEVVERSSSRLADDVLAVVFRALARNREERFQTASSFASEIEEIARRRQMTLGPEKLVEKLRELRLVEEEPEPRAFDLAPRLVPKATAIPPARLERAKSTPPPPRIWSVRNAGKILGPLTYPELVEMFVTGKVDITAEVSRGSSPFCTPSSFTELQRISSRSALQWGDSMPSGVIDRDKIRRSQLPGRIFHLAFRRETGMLALERVEAKKRVFFVDGIPESVVSTDRNELLGECLVKKGALLRMELEMALAMLSDFDGKLGDALVGLGVLKPIDLFRALLTQTEDRIVELFGWAEGEVGFLPGARSKEEVLPLGVRPFELIARGIREHYDDAEVRDLIEPVFESHILRTSPPPLRLESFRLPEAEDRVLRSLNGSQVNFKAFEEGIVSSGVATSDELYRAIFFALSCDLIRSPAWRGFVSVRP